MWDLTGEVVWCEQKIGNNIVGIFVIRCSNGWTYGGFRTMEYLELFCQKYDIGVVDTTPEEWLSNHLPDSKPGRKKQY
jgi:hypothetical protein